MPSCQELTESVTDYLEGRLNPQQRSQFMTHIKACDVCAYYLRQMERTVEALGHLPKEPLSGEAKEALADVFVSWKKQK